MWLSRETVPNPEFVDNPSPWQQTTIICAGNYLLSALMEAKGLATRDQSTSYFEMLLVASKETIRVGERLEPMMDFADTAQWAVNVAAEVLKAEYEAMPLYPNIGVDSLRKMALDNAMFTHLYASIKYLREWRNMSEEDAFTALRLRLEEGTAFSAPAAKKTGPDAAAA